MYLCAPPPFNANPRLVVIAEINSVIVGRRREPKDCVWSLPPFVDLEEEKENEET